MHPLIEELKTKARSGGLWNLFLPAGHEGAYAAKYGTDGAAGLTNLDYAPVAEATGRLSRAVGVQLQRAGTQATWKSCSSTARRAEGSVARPLLDGRIRSVFLMTEPGVASSDATTNMEATARLDGDEVVINGRKWWSTGAGHPDAKVGIFTGLTDESAPRHQQHSMVAVPLDAPGVKVERLLTAMGVYDEPIGHGGDAHRRAPPGRGDHRWAGAGLEIARPTRAGASASLHAPSSAWRSTPGTGL